MWTAGSHGANFTLSGSKVLWYSFKCPYQCQYVVCIFENKFCFYRATQRATARGGARNGGAENAGLNDVGK